MSENYEDSVNRWGPALLLLGVLLLVITLAVLL